jgi:hypothetical protein
MESIESSVDKKTYKSLPIFSGIHATRRWTGDSHGFQTAKFLKKASSTDVRIARRRPECVI